MSDPITTNKGLDLPPNGSYPNAWDVPVNQNTSDIDTALAGYATINATSASGTVALTRTQYLPLQIFIIGTLTADVNYQFPAGIGGQWVIINQTTGAHTITFSSATPGLTVVVPQGLATVISTASGSGDVRFSTDALMKDGSTTATAAIPFADGIKLGAGTAVLSSYAEGTWTPSLSFATAGTSSFSYVLQQGWYKRIGNQVTLIFILSFTPTIGTGSGNLQIGGIPVNAGSTSYAGASGSINQLSTNFSLGTRNIMVPIMVSTSLAGFAIYASGAGTGTLGAANLTDGVNHAVRGELSYFTDV